MGPNVCHVLVLVLVACASAYPENGRMRRSSTGGTGTGGSTSGSSSFSSSSSSSSSSAGSGGGGNVGSFSGVPSGGFHFPMNFGGFPAYDFNFLFQQYLAALAASQAAQAQYGAFFQPPNDDLEVSEPVNTGLKCFVTPNRYTCGRSFVRTYHSKNGYPGSNSLGADGSTSYSSSGGFPQGFGGSGGFPQGFGGSGGFPQGFAAGGGGYGGGVGGAGDGNVRASASANIGPDGGYGQGSVAPGGPDGLGLRIGESFPAPSGGNFGTFSSSSSGTSDVNGKRTSFKTATFGTNDNGKITFKTVKE